MDRPRRLVLEMTPDSILPTYISFLFKCVFLDIYMVACTMSLIQSFIILFFKDRGVSLYSPDFQTSLEFTTVMSVWKKHLCLLQ